ncbi:MAG: hypothetical protein KKC55_17915 [Gammaproteobacteria bacterium]|uniref:Uncharacterized protein n=1 Tax=viral metagenome TaxID=1070528 RepID=A0A6M3MBD9_9ZZZZ|nr:hypothetical protein [Gammaproteobacteria bacterium]
MALRYSAAMKKLRVSYELVDEKGEIIYSRVHEMRPSDGVPGRPMKLKANGSGLQIAAHNEAVAFWRELVMLGHLDDYVRSQHMPMLLPPLEGDEE